MKSPLAVAALALVSVALPACGGAGKSPADDQKAKFVDAALKHAKCMRQNGVDFPDPQVDKGGVRMVVSGSRGKDDPKLRRAMEKCKHFIDEATPVISQEERAKIERQELAHARCMRAQGINMPDPIVDSRGRVQFRAPPGGAKPDKPAFQRADEKCRKAGGGPKFQKGP